MDKTFTISKTKFFHCFAYAAESFNDFIFNYTKIILWASLITIILIIIVRRLRNMNLSLGIKIFQQLVLVCLKVFLEQNRWAFYFFLFCSKNLMFNKQVALYLQYITLNSLDVLSHTHVALILPVSLLDGLYFFIKCFSF